MDRKRESLLTAVILLTMSILCICAALGLVKFHGTDAPVVTTAPAVTTAPTESVDVPFDPAAMAAQVPEDVKKQMKQAFVSQVMPEYDLAAENVHIERVFAIFDVVYALYVEVDEMGYHTAVEQETINGVFFEFPNGQDLFVYSQGQFYRLQEAMDAQVISGEELLVIWNNYRSVYPWPEA